MAKGIIHTVPGLPDVYTIVENRTGYGTRFTPKLHGRAFTKPDNSGLYWFKSKENAEQMLIEFVSRMQEG
jgi:hypothetical protein